MGIRVLRFTEGVHSPSALTPPPAPPNADRKRVLILANVRIYDDRRLLSRIPVGHTVYSWHATLRLAEGRREQNSQTSRVPPGLAYRRLPIEILKIIAGLLF